MSLGWSIKHAMGPWAGRGGGEPHTDGRSKSLGLPIARPYYGPGTENDTVGERWDAGGGLLPS